MSYDPDNLECGRFFRPGEDRIGVGVYTLTISELEEQIKDLTHKLEILKQEELK